MKNILLSILVAVMLIGCMSPPEALTDKVLLINNVNIISMADETETIQEDVNILIINDEISVISEQEIVDIPEDVEIIDGTGKYLMPG